MGFVPISLERYVKMHMKSNPGEKEADVREGLKKCVQAALAGARCHCGAPIWVIGSTFVGHACFTCITGEGWPESDYEIDEVLAKRGTSE
ncbi:MAG TPA: hypothetical protein VG759_26790 [Candidatus Angelobacter sp.]|jgi:hypothetical protein|nr:hypothetical protein [Candidatus Angelobacter sp.]